MPLWAAFRGGTATLLRVLLTGTATGVSVRAGSGAGVALPGGAGDTTSWYCSRSSPASVRRDGVMRCPLASARIPTTDERPAALSRSTRQE
jgi:hypothetical protein